MAGSTAQQQSCQFTTHVMCIRIRVLNWYPNKYYLLNVSVKLIAPELSKNRWISDNTDDQKKFLNNVAIGVAKFSKYFSIQYNTCPSCIEIFLG